MKAAIETEGGSIDEAIEQALVALGAKREEVRVEILNDARRGLLGFGGQPARVRVTLREARRDEEAAAGTGTSPAVPSGPGTEKALPAPVDAAKAIATLTRILDLMEFPAELSAESQSDGNLRIRIGTESGGLLIGKHGQTLDGLEYLLNRIVGRQEDGGHVVLDAEDYRERRRESLEQMARSLADRAKKRGRPETMVPMSPRDRRIVHLALQKDSGVTTKSLGEGHLRRVVISPTRRN